MGKRISLLLSVVLLTVPWLQYGSKMSTIQSPAEGMPRGYVYSGEELRLLRGILRNSDYKIA
jgi:hypothetical protein